MPDADRLRTLFNLFDRDGSGTLDAEELLEILTRGSDGLSLADAKEIVDSFDENKDGVLSVDEFVKAKDDPKAKAKPQAELDDLINWANIANDESDFGASLQLGQDLFNHDLTFAPLAGRTLSMAYTLLDREVFAEIAGMHVGKRKQQQ